MTSFRIHGFPRGHEDNGAFDIWDDCPICRAMFEELDRPIHESALFRPMALHEGSKAQDQ